MVSMATTFDMMVLYLKGLLPVSCGKLKPLYLYYNGVYGHYI